MSLHESDLEKFKSLKGHSRVNFDTQNQSNFDNQSYLKRAEEQERLQEFEGLNQGIFLM